MRKNRIVSLILAVMLTATVVASALSSGALAFGAVIDVVKPFSKRVFSLSASALISEMRQSLEITICLSCA